MRNDGGTSVTIGDLAERVILLRKKSVRTEHGAVTYVYESVGDRWANVIGYNAAMVDGTVEVRNSIDYKVTMRFGIEIHAKDRLLYRGRTLTVQNEPVAVQGGKRFIMFHAEELVENG